MFLDRLVTMIGTTPHRTTPHTTRKLKLVTSTNSLISTSTGEISRINN